jgi:choline dehydrogenase-like flavoprotein
LQYLADPFTAPKIDGQYLSRDEDIEKPLTGVNLAMEMADDPAMRAFKYNTASSVPSDRAGRIDWIKQTAVTAHHPCGTCRMGCTSYS